MSKKTITNLQYVVIIGLLILLIGLIVTPKIKEMSKCDKQLQENITEWECLDRDYLGKPNILVTTNGSFDEDCGRYWFNKLCKNGM